MLTVLYTHHYALLLSATFLCLSIPLYTFILSTFILFSLSHLILFYAFTTYLLYLYYLYAALILLHF